MRPRREWPCRHLLLAGCILLAVIITSKAAHEAEPVLTDLGELVVDPPALPEEQQQQQHAQQQIPRDQTAEAAPDPATPDPSSEGAAAMPPSPSPAPHMATILPLMPMVLPGCPNDNILDSNRAWDFPKNWASMTTEQQALHPINLLLMNMVGVPSTDMMAMVNPCLHSWGAIKGSVTKIVKDYKVGNSMSMKTVVLVFRTKKHVWVVFRSTDDDWVADFDCMYTSDLRKKLNVPTPPLGAPKMQLHRGFWAAYQAVDKQLMQEVNKQLKLVKSGGLFTKPQVWLAGHSLGGALATIAAFRMAYDNWFNGEIAGIVTYGSPRVGNEVWQQLYQEKLMDKTLRWNNHRDLFAALPAKGQFCLSSSPLKTVFSFRHVGKAVLLCPSTTQPGLQEFQFYPKGTETSCATGETLIIGTHLLGHYFDGWRRAYAHRNGFPAATLLSGGPHVRSVMCSQCAIAVKPYPLPDNKAARNDGVVTCVDNKGCNDKELFGVVSWAGLFPTAFFHSDAVCDPATLLCQVPSAALTQVQNKLMEIAPNLTAAVGALASKAFQNNPMVQFFQGVLPGMSGINMTSFMAAYNGNSTAVGGGIGAQQPDHKDEAEAGDSTAEEAAESDSEPVSVKIAGGAAAVALSSSEADIVVEPSLDEDITAADEPAPSATSSSAADADASNSSSKGLVNSSSSRSDSSSMKTKVVVASSNNSTAARPDEPLKPWGKQGRRAHNHRHTDAAPSSTDSDATAASEDSSSSSSSSSEKEDVEDGEPVKAARPRSKVLDVMGGFMAGFWSHLQARAQ